MTALPEKSVAKSSYKDQKSNASTIKPKAVKPSKHNDELKQNIIALGGTTDDLDLVEGVSSGDGGEFQSDSTIDVSSDNGLFLHNEV